MTTKRVELAGSTDARVPQAHGGALLPGGQRGNKGGGRPKSLVRELAREGYEENLPRLIRIAAGTETRSVRDRDGKIVRGQPTFKESIEAMRELGNRAIGTAIEVELPQSPLVVGVLRAPRDS